MGRDKDMALPSPAVDDWRPNGGRQIFVHNDDRDQTEDAGIARTTTIWEDNAMKDAENHQVTAVSARDLANPPPRVTLTNDDNKRICRKTDKVILSILIWVYFLQILDKTILGYGALFGLQTDTNLVGNQYSLVGSIAPIAQLAWQPFSSILIVKVPPRILMPAMLLGWGIAQACTPAAHNFGGLMACRFILGLFEAGCLPLFSVITSQWYRRSEQPLRVAAWYGTNGLATIVAAALSYGLGHIDSPHLESWQIIFLFTGLVTVCSVPFVYWKLDNDPSTARFLNETERAMAVERLRANQSGADSREVRWSQVLEVFTDAKSYLFVVMSFGNNVGAQVVNTFGPLILDGLGYDKFKTSLLNIPFGAMQYIVILIVAYAAVKFRWKSLTLGSIVLPIIVGLVILFVMQRKASNTGVLLFGYYLLSFLFGCNTLIVSWILANTAGQTKKSAMMSLYNAASSAGNIVGPMLFQSKDAPKYEPGLKATLSVYIAIFWAVIVQVVNLVLMNKMQEKRRVAHGKSAKIHDHSMDERYTDMNADNDGHVGDFAFADLTDKQNDEFVYVY